MNNEDAFVNDLSQDLQEGEVVLFFQEGFLARDTTGKDVVGSSRKFDARRSWHTI